MLPAPRRELSRRLQGRARCGTPSGAHAGITLQVLEGMQGRGSERGAMLLLAVGQLWLLPTGHSFAAAETTPAFRCPSLRVPGAQPLPSPGTALQSPPAARLCPVLVSRPRKVAAAPCRAGGSRSCPLSRRWPRSFPGASRCAHELAGSNNCMRSTFGGSTC